MKVKELSQENFSSIINSDKKVLIDCYATWCGPCRMLSPIIEMLAQENTTCNFYKLDIDEAEEIAKEYEITAIPTILIFENGNLKNTLIGLKSKKEIEESLK